MTATNQTATVVDSVGREEHGSETIKKPVSEGRTGPVSDLETTLHTQGTSWSRDGSLEKLSSLIWCLGQRLGETGCGRQGPLTCAWYSGGYSAKSVSVSSYLWFPSLALTLLRFQVVNQRIYFDGLGFLSNAHRALLGSKRKGGGEDESAWELESVTEQAEVATRRSLLAGTCRSVV